MALSPDRGEHRGRFIVFEGGEGAGKSTQVSLLESRLQAAGIQTVSTREPGGTPQGEALRALFVTGAVDRWTPISEALIAYAARQEHLVNVIAPALARGQWVLCDRFSLSTRVYQGKVGGVTNPFLDRLEDEIVGDNKPDLTLILDIDPQVGLSRAKQRASNEPTTANDRFEAQNLDFHTKVREGFLLTAKQDPTGVIVIAADRPAEEVGEEVWERVCARWPTVQSSSNQ